ncbi:CHAT domain-containing protein [Lyngbya confervoides]|uniref:CHAT domain-containing protein n=1 Tax=Lyngbya confervoides BDU141951 TaxID=1574623 RepID=A0ABD4T5H3_9CYAN|nr:CHAT domain-containing protein [Lyngbya confervoides]MCM1983904.1 hypothetical protein [Lyngbya confervoides BDU141951]
MKTILFLAANPDDTAALKLNRELRNIQEEELKKSKYRDDFKCERRDAVRWEDLERAILELKPRIVHFCGHGAGQAGLVIENQQGQSVLLSGEILAGLFKQVADTLECVLLNACYSKAQAEAIQGHVNYVIGANSTIADAAAIAYANGFYRALGAGRSIPSAHEAGCLEIQVQSCTLEKPRDILAPEIESPEPQAAIASHLPILLIKDPLTAFPDSLRQDVQEGLDVLVGLLSIPDVNSRVTLFQSEFSAICAQIMWLRFYKQLHDLLHQVEIQYYRELVKSARLFPEDDITVTTFYEYELALRAVIHEAQAIVVQPACSGYDCAWLAKLEEACNELQAAITQLDQRRLKKTIYLMTVLLADQPIRLNMALTTTAKALRLASLAQTLNQLHQDLLMLIAGNPSSLQPLQAGIQSLENLNQQLNHLIQTHDGWQTLDSILRRIETNLNRDTEELEWSWTDIKEKIATLCQQDSEADLLQLQQAEQNLDQALEIQNPSRIRHCFWIYRRVALMRFSSVDLRLVKFCDELQKIGHTLELIVTKIS